MDMSRTSSPAKRPLTVRDDDATIVNVDTESRAATTEGPMDGPAPATPDAASVNPFGTLLPMDPQRRQAISMTAFIFTILFVVPTFMHVSGVGQRLVDHMLDDTPSASEAAPSIGAETALSAKIEFGAADDASPVPDASPAPAAKKSAFKLPSIKIGGSSGSSDVVMLGPKHNRFTDSGVAFPLACSFQQALDGMLSAGKENIAMGREYLPDIDFTKCDTHPDDLDAVFTRMFAVTPPTSTFDWCGGMQCKITMGKYTSKASEDWEKFVKTAQDDAPPPRAMAVFPKQERWGRYLDCAIDDAWNCMFGVTTPSKSAKADEGALKTARNVWSQRSCIFDRSCGEPQSRYLSKLIHGWMFRWQMPLNACTEGYRNSCVNNVVSNVNLPKATRNRVFLSIHMRMGDACDRVEKEERTLSWEWNQNRGRPCIAPHGYDKAIERMTAKYGVTDILLASDQSDAVEWAKEQKKHDVHWLDTDRSKLNHGAGWIENRMDIGKEETEGALEALDFLAHGQVFIGNMGSFFSRAVYKQMVGRHNVVAPWTSIDGRHLPPDDDRGKEWHEFLGRRRTSRRALSVSD